MDHFRRGYSTAVWNEAVSSASYPDCALFLATVRENQPKSARV